MTETTNTTMPSPQPLKRCAIIGTAQSWKECPFGDKTLEVWGLNDAYMVGVPRADRWFDIHPFHQMVFRTERNVNAADVPTGCYLRPQGHLDWLRTRPMPVYLEHARPDFPTSQTFPLQQVLDFFAPHWPYRVTRTGQITGGPDYEVSSPSWMLMLAILEGYQEIHVYGIHLATQWEYIEQRPNFEWLLGFASGRGIKIVLPQSTPICRAKYRYGFEPKADIPLQQIEQQIVGIKTEGAKLKEELTKLPTWAIGRKKDLLARQVRLDAQLADARQAQSRIHVTLGA
jgi:hypothetical protein